MYFNYSVLKNKIFEKSEDMNNFINLNSDRKGGLLVKNECSQFKKMVDYFLVRYSNLLLI